MERKSFFSYEKGEGDLTYVYKTTNTWRGKNLLLQQTTGIEKNPEKRN